MPKFTKGNPEMKAFMADLRAKRGTTNRPITTNKQVSNITWYQLQLLKFLKN